MKATAISTTALIDSEDAAKAWLTGELNVSRETLDRLDCLCIEVLAETARQNLIAKSTFDSIWVRHVVDSAQLLRWYEKRTEDGPWLDLGAGAGFPGLVVAILTDAPIVLVESRARRIDFLKRTVDKLDLGARVSVVGSRLEKVKPFPASVISARAFAPLGKLIDLSRRFSTRNTLWLLPKGKNAVNELETLPPKWHSAFHVEQSLTSEEAKILVGRGLK